MTAPYTKQQRACTHDMRPVARYAQARTLYECRACQVRVWRCTTRDDARVPVAGSTQQQGAEIR